MPETTSTPTPNGSPQSLAPSPNRPSSTSSAATDDQPRSDQKTRPTEQPAKRLARLITEVFSPGILVAALLLLVAWHASDTTAQAITYGLIAAAAASFLPVFYIIRGVRQGRWTDKHVVVHSQRRLPLLIILISTVAGTTALALAGAPRELLALIASMVASLLVAVPITLLARWGISIHALVAAGTVAALTVIFGPAMALGSVLVILVAWARVRLGEHTLGQVLAGATVGALATGVLFPFLS